MLIDRDAVNFSVSYLDYLISHGSQCQIVCNHYNTDSALPAGILQKLQNLFSGIVVQCPCRLITQQKLRIFGKCAGNWHTLLFSTGQLCREIGGTLLQSDSFNRFIDI